MAVTDPNKPLCWKCNRRNSQERLAGLCRGCYEAQLGQSPHAKPEFPQIDTKGLKTQDDWVKLAESLEEVYKGVADGTVKATAAQSRMLADIWNRAYGRATKSQEDKTGATGIVLLPKVGQAEYTSICPNCHSKYDKIVLAQWQAFLRSDGKRIKLSYGGEYGAEDVGGASGDDQSLLSPTESDISLQTEMDGTDGVVGKSD